MNKVDKAHILLASILHGPASTCTVPSEETRNEASPRSAAHFFAQLQAACTWLELEEVLDTVEAQYQRGDLTQAEAEELAQVAAQQSRNIPARFEYMALDAFAQCGRVLRMASKVLDETVLLAADNADVPVDNTLVVYQVQELKALIGMPPNQVRIIHDVKKSCNGEIVYPEEEEDVLWVEDLLNKSNHENRCYSCNQEVWWYQGDRRLCGICHPNPKEQKNK